MDNQIISIIYSDIDVDDKIRKIIELFYEYHKIEKEDHFWYNKTSKFTLFGHVSDPLRNSLLEDSLLEDIYQYSIYHLYYEALIELYHQSYFTKINDKIDIEILIKLRDLRRLYPQEQKVEEVYLRYYLFIQNLVAEFYKLSEFIYINIKQQYKPIYFDTDTFFLQQKIDPILELKWNGYNLTFNLEENKIPYMTFLGKKKYIKYQEGEFFTKGLIRQANHTYNYSNRLKESSVYNEFVGQVLTKIRDKKLTELGF